MCGLASKLCGWDIEIMTQDELQEQIESAVAGFASIEGVTEEVAERLVGEGFLSYDDLSVIEPDDLMEMGGLSEEVVERIIEQAEGKAEEAEQAAAAERRRLKEQERIERATAELEAIEGSERETPTAEAGIDAESAAGGVAESHSADTLNSSTEAASPEATSSRLTRLTDDASRRDA